MRVRGYIRAELAELAFLSAILAWAMAIRLAFSLELVARIAGVPENNAASHLESRRSRNHKFFLFLFLFFFFRGV